MLKTIARINPVDEFVQMANMMDRIFGTSNWDRTPVVNDQSRVAPVDVMEKDDKLIVRAALPGVAPEDIKVNVENNVLTIEGESKHEEVSEDTRVYCRECNYGKFTRSLRLAENLALDQVDASFKNGIVEITIPRIVEEKKSISIQVRTE